MDQGLSSMIEWGAYVNVWMFTGLMILMLGKFFSKEGLSLGAEICVVMALLVGGVVLGSLHSPLEVHESVGQVLIFNWLLYLYGLPAIAAILFAILGRRFERRLSPLIVGFFGVLSIFMLITLQVRHAFRGEFLDGFSQGNSPSITEWYGYSASWLVYCLVLVGVAYWVHKRTHSMVRASEVTSSKFEPAVPLAPKMETGE
jgi:uncharacterized membrane protein